MFNFEDFCQYQDFYYGVNYSHRALKIELDGTTTTVKQVLPQNFE